MKNELKKQLLLQVNDCFTNLPTASEVKRPMLPVLFPQSIKVRVKRQQKYLPSVTRKNTLH